MNKKGGRENLAAFMTYVVRQNTAFAAPPSSSEDSERLEEKQKFLYRCGWGIKPRRQIKLQD